MMMMTPNINDKKFTIFDYYEGSIIYSYSYSDIESLYKHIRSTTLSWRTNIILLNQDRRLLDSLALGIGQNVKDLCRFGLKLGSARKAMIITIRD